VALELAWGLAYLPWRTGGREGGREGGVKDAQSMFSAKKSCA